MGLLEGKTALVTGASHGIGRAICLKLARAGASIAALDIDEGALNETGGLVGAAGAAFLAIGADVCDMAQMQDAVARTADSFGSLDVMVNNAGITRDNLLVRMSEQDWQSVISVNLTGVFNGIRAAARIMTRQRSGSIVNMASIVGIIGNAGQCNYAASKAGVIGLTKAAARELARKNVRVNAVAPGYIATRMTERLAEEAKKALLERIPLRKLGQPEDVADAVLFLASAASSYITGQVIGVDGGMAM